MDLTLFQLSSQPSRTFFLLTSYNDHSNDTDGERRRCPANLLPFQPLLIPPLGKRLPTEPTEEPQPFRSGSSKISTKAPLHQTSSTASRDDAVAQIWRLYCSGKQTKSDLALRPSSSHKSTKNQSETPTTLHPNSLHSAPNSSPVSHLKDRPLPLPSTLTPAHPSPARRSMPSTLTPANPPCLTLPSTRNPASTQHPVRPSTMTPASTQLLGGGASDTSTTGAALGFCLLGLSHCNGPPLVSRPTGEISRPRTENFLPNLCQNLSFRLISRSKNSTANDLAKKAIWSMTAGPSSM